ncbi:peroxiredoxin [bacterium]|nr:peroxiredoxin [bacterium]
MEGIYYSILLLMTVISGILIAGNSQVVTGKAAPDFTLKDQQNKEYTLSDYHGQWILIYFYPKDDTPGCTAEACAFRDRYEAFQTAELKVFGISIDHLESHRQFAEKYNLPFSILADTTGEVTRVYGVKHPVLNMAKRQSFLIDPEGIIRKIYKNVTPAHHPEEIISDLKQFRGE